MQKKHFFDDKIKDSKGDSKKLWNTLKLIGCSAKKANSKIGLTVDNESIFDEKSVAENSVNFSQQLPPPMLRNYQSPQMSVTKLL